MKNRLRDKVFFVLCFCCVPVLSSCQNGNNVKATGMVVFDDGTPLTTGIVVFKSSQHQYSGIINQDGTFQLGGLKTGDGLPPGTYKVALTNVTDDEGESPIHPKYSNADESGLSFDIGSVVKDPLRVIVAHP